MATQSWHSQSLWWATDDTKTVRLMVFELPEDPNGRLVKIWSSNWQSSSAQVHERLDYKNGLNRIIMQITYHNHATVYHASLAFLSQRRSLASKKIPCFCHQSSLTIPLHSSWILCFTPRIALGPAKNETAAWTVTILDDLQIPPENQIPLVLENWNLSQGLLKKEVVSSKDVQ